MLPKQPLRLIFAFEDVRNSNEAVLSRGEGNSYTLTCCGGPGLPFLQTAFFS
jgi:hypothetical protein